MLDEVQPPDSPHSVRLAILTSPGFLGGLATLLVNDFVLKSASPNLLTGKLSDFAGLWIFPAFLVAMLPGRRGAVVSYVATLVAFVVWKSEFSQQVIDAWNSLSPITIARVVDPLDLLALSVLPISHVYFVRRRAPVSAGRLRSAAMFVVMLIGVFAFGATSRTKLPPPRYEYEGFTYSFDVPKSALLAELREIDLLEREYGEPDFFAVSVSVRVSVEECEDDDGDEGIDFEVDLADREGDTSQVILRRALIRCRYDDLALEASEVRATFEESIVNRFRDLPKVPPE